MRGFAWGCVVAGVVLAVAAFFLTANAPTINPWPSLLAGLCLTALGIVLLAIQRNRKP
jgi:uncharacterized membrane protein HdeD (DUF308 family)